MRNTCAPVCEYNVDVEIRLLIYVYTTAMLNCVCAPLRVPVNVTVRVRIYVRPMWDVKLHICVYNIDVEICTPAYVCTLYA